MPHSFQLLLALLTTADKQMAVLRLAALHLHKLVKLQHAPLAAGISLRALMEDRETWVVHTALA